MNYTEEYWFLKDLNRKQQDICLSEDNLLITACPGSGKTKTLTYRLAYLSKKYNASRLRNIAITYTNRAAEEIKDRLLNFDIDYDNVWTGTIHQFCLEYIIRPYAMYSMRLCKGYTIIDEYVQSQYISDICKELNLKLSYLDEAFSNSEVQRKYLLLLEERREIDFDLILELSFNLLSENIFISRNIASTIRSIHIDEFQDTNLLQYKILAEIAKQNKLMQIQFIGDLNQAIYGGIGGVALNREELDNLFNTCFYEETLDGCYRSTQRIIDYYSRFQVGNVNIRSLASYKEEVGIISYSLDIEKTNLIDSIAKIIQQQIDNGIPESEICVVAPQWWLLYPVSRALRNKLPQINFDAPDLTPIKYDPINVYFLISRLLFTEAGRKTHIRKRIAVEIISILNDIYNINLPEFVDTYYILKCINSIEPVIDDGIETLEIAIKLLFHNCRIVLEEQPKLKKSYDDFIDKIYHRIETNKLSYDIDTFRKSFKINEGVVINTNHGIKGEEYTTVIAFGLLNGYLPNWNLIINAHREQREEEANKLLYVICSRAKTNLFLFSEKGRTTKKGYPMSPTEELNSFKYKYD